MRFAGIHPSLPIICVALFANNHIEDCLLDAHRLRTMKGRMLFKDVEGEAMFFEARDRVTMEQSLKNAGIDVASSERFEAAMQVSDTQWQALMSDITLSQILPSTLLINDAGQVAIVNEYMPRWRVAEDAFTCWMTLPSEHLSNVLPAASAAIEPVLCVSTAHIPQEFAQALDRGEQLSGLLTVFRNEYGWVLYIGEDEEGELVPKQLSAITEAAKRLGTAYLRFDADGMEVEGLPTYHWN